MGQVIGDLLPIAVGVAISPIPIIAIILMLITPKAKVNGTAFLVGWLLGLTIVGVIVLLVAGASGASEGGSASTATDALKLVLGILFLGLAAKQWRSRPAAGAVPVMPKWMGLIDTFTPVKSAGLALALSGVNPKNLILSVSAGATIAQSGLPGGQQALCLAVYVLLGSITIAAPLVVYLAGGAKAKETLDGWKSWLGASNATIMAVLFVVFGFVLIGKGIGGLSS